MTIGAIIGLFIILLISAFTLLLSIYIKDYLLGIVAAIGFLSCGCLIMKEFNEPEIKAIDVYRGRTTLQITYQDSIPVDTVVVFKNK